MITNNNDDDDDNNIIRIIMMACGLYIPTFRRNVLRPFSGHSKQCVQIRRRNSGLRTVVCARREPMGDVTPKTILRAETCWQYDPPKDGTNL